MKWRSSLIYLIVLLLLGGYYYYFEVVRKEQRENTARLAKRVFDLKEPDIKGVKIDSKEKKSVQLARNGDWKVVQPLECAADQATMEGLVGTLVTLESQRTIAEKKQDLKPYGLDNPALTIRIEYTDKSVQLLLGDKNPTGDGYYGKIAGGDQIFLVSEGVWGVLNKGLDELRRHELFTFQPQEVVALGVTWKNGAEVSVQRQNAQDKWSSPHHPEIKIKADKVQSVLDQLSWLRAQKFVDNRTDNLSGNGLAPPEVTVQLRMTEDRSAQLLLSGKHDDAKEITAVSSEVPAIVTVPADILKNLPATVGSLQDRSLFTLKPDEVTTVKWHLNGRQEEVTRTDVNKWEWSGADQEQKEIKDSWKVSSLVYDLSHAEYLEEVDPAPAVPAQPHGRIDFFGKDGKLVSITWNKPNGESASTSTLWIETGENGTVAVVEVEAELMRRAEEDLSQLANQSKPR